MKSNKNDIVENKPYKKSAKNKKYSKMNCSANNKYSASGS